MGRVSKHLWYGWISADLEISGDAACIGSEGGNQSGAFKVPLGEVQIPDDSAVLAHSLADGGAFENGQ